MGVARAVIDRQPAAVDAS